MAQEPDTSNATISLVMGILSLLIPILGVIFGILAIVYYKKQRKIAENSTATAGLVCGIIGLVFNALFLVVIVFIGMLAYFGTLSPESFLPTQCTATYPFRCENFSSSNGLTLMISNVANMELETVTVELLCDGKDVKSTPINMQQAQTSSIVIPECALQEQTHTPFVVTYVAEGMKRSASGSVIIN